MRTGLIAKKLGMTRFFDAEGLHVPVTVLSLDGCQVVAQRTMDKDGYTALQLGAGSRKAKNVSNAERVRFAKAEVAPKATLAEFRVDEANLIEVGAELQRGVAVLVSGAMGGHLAAVERQHRDGDVRPRFVEEAGHAQLFGDHARAHGPRPLRA